MKLLTQEINTELRMTGELLLVAYDVSGTHRVEMKLSIGGSNADVVPNATPSWPHPSASSSTSPQLPDSSSPVHLLCSVSSPLDTNHIQPLLSGGSEVFVRRLVPPERWMPANLRAEPQTALLTRSAPSTPHHISVVLRSHLTICGPDIAYNPVCLQLPLQIASRYSVAISSHRID